MLKKLILPLSFLVLSCSPPSPKLEPLRIKEQVSSAIFSADFSAKVDILFVIDDSGSMSTYQQNLSKNVDALVASIQKSKILDYHIGVITTSADAFGGGGRLVSKGSGPKYIDRGTKNGLQLLRDYVKVGTNGSAEEKFFLPIERALSSPLIDTENIGFLRPEAALVLIVISDAEDQSKNANNQNYTPEEMINFLVNDVKDGDSSQILPYAIVIPSQNSETKDCTRDFAPPAKLEKVLKFFAGYEFNLCDKDYNASLDSLGKDIVKRIPRVAYLNRRPVADTIVVKYDGKEIPNNAETGWTYDPYKNAIYFSLYMIQALAGTSSNLEVNFTAANDVK